MSRSFPTDVLQTFCPPEWVAKAYSEYMLSCSQAILDIQNAIMEAATSDILNGLVDSLMSTRDDGYDGIIKIVLSMYEPSDLVGYNDITDPLFAEKFVEIFDGDHPQEESEILAIFDSLYAINATFQTYAEDESLYAALIRYKDPGTFLSTCDTYVSTRNAQITSALTSLNMNPQAPFTLDEGFVSLSELFTSTINNVLGADEGYFQLSVKNAAGSVLSLETYNSDSIFEQIKASFASCVAWGTGFAAIAKEKVSDAVAYFNANISTMISDTTEKFANTVNNVRAHLSSVSGNIKDFFDIAYTELGWKAVVEDSFSKVDQTDVFAYTGASPLSAMNANVLVNVGAAIGKTVCAIGAGIFTAAKKLAEKAWKKAKPYVLLMLNMPKDIGVVDENDDSYTCSNFTAQVSHAFYVYEFTTSDQASMLISILSSKTNKWIALNTYFGEIFFRILGAQYEPGSNKKVQIIFDARYRPKCMNYREALSRNICYINNLSAADHRVAFNPIPQGHPDLTLDAWSDFINADYRPSDDEDEGYLFMGFWLANVMTFQLGSYAAKELLEWGASNNIPTPVVHVRNNQNIYNEFDFIPHTVQYWLGEYADPDGAVPLFVSNLNFLQQTAGAATSGQDVYFDYFPCASNSDPQLANNSSFSLDMLLVGYITAFIVQQWDKYNNPTEYLFLPYCNDTLNPPSGRYRIKTDADNANIASVIADAIIVIVAVVATIIIVSKIKRNIKAKKLAKWSRTVGMLDDKMWKGGKLTGKEARKYARYKKKIDKLSGATSGLASAGSALKGITDSVSNLSSNNVSDISTNFDDTNHNLLSIINLIK